MDIGYDKALSLLNDTKKYDVIGIFFEADHNHKIKYDDASRIWTTSDKAF